MSQIARPPNPSLVAIILLVKSRAGPRFVFHYPAHPNPNARGPSSSSSASSTSPSTPASRRNSSKSKDGDNDESVSSDSDNDASSSEEEERGLHASKNISARATTAAEGRRSGQYNDKDGLRSSSGGKFGSTASLQQHRRSVNSEPDDGTSTTGGGGGGVSTAGGAAGTGSGSGVASEAAKGDSPLNWESLFGLETCVWEKLLSPAESFRKRKFEVGINDLAFVGWPVFVKADGSWGRKRRSRRRGQLDSTSVAENASVTRVSELAECLHASEESEKAASSPDSKDDLVMFNVIFVLNPPALEHNLRVREQYDNVIQKFGKGLKAEQARAGYVWKEVQTISRIKERARDARSSTAELYAELGTKSSLFRAVANIYESISKSKIASVQLTPEAMMSLQIPPITSTPYLPTATETAYPGLWLTTAESLESHGEDEGNDSGGGGGGGGAVGAGPNGVDRPHVLAKHRALLLLVDERQILKDIDMSGSFGSRLAHYVRVTRPNKSFAQISASTGIPLSDIQILAGHLVYWRRARVIPPLNQQDTYIVSPNADLRQLAQATVAYQEAFPTMPSLPKMLTRLSGPPRTFATLIPSRDHKEVYYSVLAWLLRGGWVTQLRTFAWVKVCPEIKAAVSEAIRLEKLAEKGGDEGGDDGSKEVATEGHDRDRETEAATTTAPETPATATSPPSDEHGIPSSTAAAPTTDDEEEDSVHSGYSRQDEGRRQSNPHLDHLMSTLILKPYRASPMESRWLDEVQARFPDRARQQLQQLLQQQRQHLHPNAATGDPDPSHAGSQGASGPTAALLSGMTSGTTTPGYETDFAFGLGTDDGGDEEALRKYWPVLSKYFNGRDSMESIAIREGLKRKVVKRLLGKIDEGVLTLPREPLAGSKTAGPAYGPKEKVLVKVRHW